MTNVIVKNTCLPQKRALLAQTEDSPAYGGRYLKNKNAVHADE